MSGPPERVIRFYSNPQYALECIAFKQITFLHIDKLNDPFDPYYHFETDFNEDYQHLIDYVQQNHSGYLQVFKHILPKENWESAAEGTHEYFRKLRNSTFIFSTSGIGEGKHPKDNLHMWSHYGDGHRGVAIEFDTALLAGAVVKQQEKIDGSKPTINELWVEINYKKELPEITCEHIFKHAMNIDKAELERILAQRLSLKSDEWEIEKEWRIIWRNDETKVKVLRLDLIDDTITAVYLGLRYQLIDDHKNDEFIFETKRNFPKAEIFKARQKKAKFALDFERIDRPDNANT